MLLHDLQTLPMVRTISNCHAGVCHSRHLPSGAIRYECAHNAEELELDAIGALAAHRHSCLLGAHVPCLPELATQAVGPNDQSSTRPAVSAASQDLRDGMTSPLVVISDDAAALEASLTICGYSVLTRSPATLDMAELVQLNPKVILLEWHVDQPEQGWQTFKWIKFHPPTAHIPMLMCAAATVWAQEVEGFLRSQGVVVYQSCQLGELQAALRRALEPEAELRAQARGGTQVEERTAPILQQNDVGEHESQRHSERSSSHAA